MYANLARSEVRGTSPTKSSAMQQYFDVSLWMISSARNKYCCVVVKVLIWFLFFKGQHRYFKGYFPFVNLMGTFCLYFFFNLIGKTKEEINLRQRSWSQSHVRTSGQTSAQWRTERRGRNCRFTWREESYFPLLRFMKCCWFYVSRRKIIVFFCFNIWCLTSWRRGWWGWGQTQFGEKQERLTK